MNWTYKILFKVALKHDYFSNGKCPDVAIVPTAQTLLLLEQRKLRYKLHEGELIVFGRTDAGGLFLLPLAAADVFRFYLVATNASFYNYTNLSFSPGDNKRCYFSNLSANKNNGQLYLTKPLPLYDSNRSYLPGDFCISSTGDVFEAVKKSTSAAPKNTTQADFWRKKINKQYAAGTDNITCVPGHGECKVSAPVKDFTIDVFALNTATGNFDVPCLPSTTVSFRTATDTISVDTASLQEMLIRRKVNSTEDIVYSDSRIKSTGAFGIVELYNLPVNGADFSFFNNDGTAAEKTFNICFGSRSVIWMYRSRTAEVTAIKDSDNNFQWQSTIPMQFTSRLPIPLSEKPYTSFFLESSRLGQVKPLKNAAIEMMSTISQDGSDYYCAVINLNY